MVLSPPTFALILKKRHLSIPRFNYHNPHDSLKQVVCDHSMRKLELFCVKADDLSVLTDLLCKVIIQVRPLQKAALQPSTLVV